LNLLPTDFDKMANVAVQSFWAHRTAPSKARQGGTRDGVTDGRNMDAFIDLVITVADHCGLPRSAVKTGRRDVILPGYFRATKNWDVLVIDRRRLVAVFEFKSQVGSFGNNLNNRSEEVIGSAADLWVAHFHGAYQDEPPPMMVSDDQRQRPLLNPAIQTDPRPPYLGWLMLLEECEKSTRPVRCAEPHFHVFPEFQGASYAQRYQILCERLVERQLYGGAALVLSPADKGLPAGAHRALSPATSLRNLFAEFAGRVAASASSPQ